jgi:hypothetical protein
VTPIFAVDAPPADLPAARVEVERALALAQTAGDDPERTAAATSLATLRWLDGDRAGAVAAWRSSLPFLRARPHAELAAVLGLAHAAGREGAWTEAERWLARAAEVGERTGDAGLRARARLAKADAAERRGQLLAALADAEAVWAGHPERAAPVVVRLCLALGDPLRARPVAELVGDVPLQAAIALQLGEDPGPLPEALRPWGAALAGRWGEVEGAGVPGAWRSLAEGDADAALAAFDGARIALDAEGWPAEAAVRGVWSAGAIAAQGRPKAALGLLAELERLLDDADPALVGAPFDLARARVARAAGDETTAQALAAAARARAPHPPLATQVDLRVFGG